MKKSGFSLLEKPCELGAEFAGSSQSRMLFFMASW